MSAAPKPVGFADAHPLTTRERLELEIERLIDMLDAFDGDADIELNGDEEDQSFPGISGWHPAGPYYLEDDEEGGDADEPHNPVTLNGRQRPTRRVRRPCSG